MGALWLPLSLSAQEQETDSTEKQTTFLNEVIVTGNLKTDPVLTETANDLAQKIVQPKNVADLFKDVNGFSLIKRGNYAIDPSFRGSQYEQLNLQFNGGTKAMHACPNRMDPVTTHIIPEEIADIEVIKGPYSVRYGATFGGIVNLVTQMPDLNEKGLSGFVHGGYESNGNTVVTSAGLTQVWDRWDVMATGGYRDFGNYEDGDGTEIPSAFRSTDYGVRLGFRPTEDQRLQAHWRQSFGRDVLHAGLPMDTEYDDSSILSLDYSHKALNGFFTKLAAKAYYSYVDHLMSNVNRPNFMMVHAVSPVEATTVGGKLELTSKKLGKTWFYLGADYFGIAREGNRTRTIKRNMMGMPLAQPMVKVDKIWQDAYVNDLGIFWEAKHPLTDKTLLTVGARYDRVVSEAQDPAEDFLTMYPDLDKRTENNISATASIKYRMTEDFLLEMAYGRGVRSANMTERFINHFSVGPDGFEYVGNPNLDAEVNNQFEIGFKGKAHGETSSFDYGLSAYYSIYDNHIVPIIDPNVPRKYMPTTPPTVAKVYQNVDDAYKTGFEAYGSLNFAEHFELGTQLSYVYAKNKDLNEPLPLIPPFTARFTAGFDNSKFWGKIDWTLKSSQENISESFAEQVTPGYGLVDLRAGIRAFKNLDIGVAAMNVFDKTYHDHLNFSFANQPGFGRVPINDPGRNLSAFVQYKF
ncbi:TonB-dependent receptor [Sediminicola luteus]|uniref:TonB-dependent receptor n=2 Tax=Sediminicola luteus TaxID=319238 RepID=A0A2A4GCN9_9FLAO|nr:TonB-dependent receptor [Sediminicola luteus]